MLLHRYFGSHAFETLDEVTLKVSRISTFNDPFEFLYVPIGKMTPQKARTMVEYKINNPDASPHFWFVARQRFSNAKNEKELKRLVRKSIPQLVINLVSGFEKIKNTTLENRGNVADANLRAICFCDADKVKPLDEILIWSHYANKHKGVRIGFEFPDGIVDEITYREKRLEIDLSIMDSNDATGSALMQSIKSKSKAWEYEHEHRLITVKGMCEERTMPDSTVEHFLNFNREWVKSIDFGVRCLPKAIEDILALIKTDYPQKVMCRKAEYHKTEYALEYKPI